VEPRVALLEYFVTETRTLVFLARDTFDAPRVHEVRDPASGRAVGAAALRDCLDRLMLDFHGLPPGWDAGLETARWERALALEPRVTHAARRGGALVQRDLLKPVFGYELTYWEQLGGALLPAVLRAEIDDCELLCIVPHGPLHALPFAALRWSETQRLVERFALCHAPSATVLRHCRARAGALEAARQGRAARWLVAAVAAEDDAEPDDFERDGELLAALAADGGARLTRLVGPVASVGIDTGVDAAVDTTAGVDGVRPVTKRALREALAEQDVVHLACHGVFGLRDDAGSLDDSGLLVSNDGRRPPLARLRALPAEAQGDFLLSAREVLGLQLAARLVTLRACSSGRSLRRAGDELDGLVRAVLQAGASALIAGLWDVHKASSRRLLGDFYRYWLDPADPQPAWRALQRAQLALLHDADDARLRHPFHWAPFILVGHWS